MITEIPGFWADIFGPNKDLAKLISAIALMAIIFMAIIFYLYITTKIEKSITESDKRSAYIFELIMVVIVVICLMALGFLYIPR